MLIGHLPCTRAKKATEVVTPSNTPVSVTQTLSQLRLTHARLLEEHGVTVALLRQREADVHEADRRVSEVDDTVIALEADIRDLKDQVERREQRVILADREVGFLQALVVRLLPLRFTLAAQFQLETYTG
jgi:mitotic spindle assembly checkpoint protein MAD1